MKVSEITNELLASYLRLDFASMTTAEKTELTTLTGVAKSFIRGYTGISERTITGEEIAIGDGETKEYYTDYPVIPGTESVYIDGVEITETTDYLLDDATGRINLVEVLADSAELTGDYTTGLDAYEDFVIAVYVLCQDMYDNRSFYVDKNNINRVVDSILGMHSVNLL
ncbi:hypothetical protein LPY66_18195 [Dehalobacter sp. DCM]|uniref:hypothetical protein n=1 Tax=Dehalobacter sp. DCM TaxID=2907827 RepID=UPI003081E977|nr:hypothetical protein LPY66_18195 [Dehalobacter sp. DCM]